MRYRVLIAAACALVLSACSHEYVVGPTRVLRMALSEYRLRPQDVRAQAGPLTIFVHNYGRLTHNLSVSMDGFDAGSTAPLLPGQSAELQLFLIPGRYQMSSTILSDGALGQFGTLTVTG